MNEAMLAHAAASKASFGRRRTAYPLDMTLADLVERRIAISPRVVNRVEPTAGATPSVILDRLRANGSAVLLGAPGAGKSMALLQLASAWSGAEVTPILIRIAEVIEEIEVLRRLLSQAGNPPPVLLLDGLDEAMATPDSRPETARALRALMSLAPTVLTSRTRDFEEAAYLDRYGIVVDDLYELLPWRTDIEFSLFVRRLHASGHLSRTSLVADVASSPGLSRLASRPLHARMLTLVMEIDPTNPPETQSDLYGSYLYHLGRVADTSLAGRGCHLPQGAFDYWLDVAWVVFDSGTAAPEPGAIIKATTEVGGPSATCLRSAIDVIANRVPHGGGERLEFVHYSFFEWLLATRIRQRISERPMTVDLLFETFSRDLPREVRHHLRQQLGSISAQMTNDLVRHYLAAHQRTADARATLAVCNLIVYLISRCARNAAPALRELLEEEREPFLASALLWSLTHQGDGAATAEFFRRFSLDDGWRRITRGYTLYYYGDLSDVNGPPYFDLDPYESCDRSLQALNEIFASRAVDKIPKERQAVDLLTILDILDTRSLRLTRDRFAPIVDAATRVTDALRTPDVTHEIHSRLSRVLV